MIRFLALSVAALLLLAVLVPNVRTIVAWVLAFLSLLMLGDLVRSSLTKLRRRR